MNKVESKVTWEREVIKGFLTRHRLDYFYDVGGCETCGPEYEWNCSCGISGMGSSGFGDHQEDMVNLWLGDSGPEITKEGDVEW